MIGGVLVTMDGIERCVARRIFERDRGSVVAARLFREGSHGIEDDASGHMGRARGARLGQQRPRKGSVAEPDHREWAVHEFSYVPDAWW